MAETRVQFWAVHALSGQVLGEVPVSHASIASALGGGSLTATVALGQLRTADGSGVDLPAVEHVMGLVTPGIRCLVATAGTQTLGEWVVMQHDPPSASGLVRIQGAEWVSYPQMRTLWTSYDYEDVEQMTIARELVGNAFNEPLQSELQLTIPTPSASGIPRSLSRRMREATYAQVLDSIADTEDGFEWHVDSQMQWTEGAPTHVQRTVVWGYPVIGRTSPLAITHDGQGTVSGTALWYSQGRDYRQVRTLAAILAAGEGRRKVVAYADVERNGHLAHTTVWNLPDTRSEAAALAFARSKLAAPPEGMWLPPQADVLVGKLPAWPRVGDRALVDIHPTLTVPAGRHGVLRIGDVSCEVRAGRAEVVTVAGIEEGT